MPNAGAPEITIFKVNRHGESVGTVAMCTRDRVAAGTAISWMAADYSFLKPGQTVTRYIVQGHVLTLQRNECVQNMQGEWIVFVDDDMTFQPDAVSRLVATAYENDLDMVGGLCFQRGEPHQPTLYMRERPDGGNYLFLEDWEKDAVVEVDATGMAFVLIRRRVFERIAGEFPPLAQRLSGRPPSYFRWDESGYGEDLAFCQLVKKAGMRIFVDTSVAVGHIGEQHITEETFLLQLINRSPLVTEKRKLINDAMGLPTMTSYAAMERLRGRS